PEPINLPAIVEHTQKPFPKIAETRLFQELPRFSDMVEHSAEPIVIPNVYDHPELSPHRDAYARLQTHAVLAVRTAYQGETNGILHFHRCSPNREWLAEDIRLAEALANQIGLAIAQAELTAREISQQNELETAKLSAEAANRAKTRFLANMTHELRTPLNSILGFCQLLSREKSTTSSQQKTLKIINNSGEHLLGLINDVLEMSKIEEGHSNLELETFELHPMLDSVHQILALRAKGKGLQFQLEKSFPDRLSITTDKKKLRQVLINLIGNAIKFTHKGSIDLKVCLTGSGEKTRPQRVDFEVIDSGAGISEEELRKLFQPFVQAEAGKQSQQGTGLGLALSRNFVEMMGGKIEASSIPGEGSSFHFHIRCETAIADTPMNALSGEEQPPRFERLEADEPERRILVAEDNPANQTLLVKLLESVGFTVATAEDGEQAVEATRRFQPHLIFMDIDMPNLRGDEATRIICRELGSDAPHIVALTASALEETRESAMQAGCCRFMTKPFQPAQIFQTTSELLGATFIRNQTTEDTDKPASTSTDFDVDQLADVLQQQSADFLDQLRSTSKSLNYKETAIVIEKLRPHENAAADLLLNWATNFEFDRISGLVDELLAGSKS
ncbi:MAG: ATP-binding protein, partial [Verrucomicrobiota bacterium]